MASYTKKAFYGTVNVLVFTVLAAFVAYLIRVYLARKLSPGEFGLFYAMFTLILFLTSISTMGTINSLVRYGATYLAKGNNQRVKDTIINTFVFRLMSSAVFCLVLYFLADFLAKYYFKVDSSAQIFSFLAVYLVINSFDETIKRSFQAFQKMFLFSIYEFAKNLVILILIYVFFAMGWTIYSPAVSYVISGVIMFIVSFPVMAIVFPYFKYRSRVSLRFMKRLLFFGLPTIFSTIGYRIIGYLDVLMLTYFVSLSDVGIYNVILPSATLFLFVSRAIVLVLLPMSAELWAKGEHAKLADGFQKLQRYMLIFIVPVVFALFSFSSIFIFFVFGKQYVAGSSAFKILLAGVPFFSLTMLNEKLLVGVGKPKKSAHILIASMALNVVLNIALIPSYGILGGAAATSITYVFSLVFSDILLSRVVKVKMPLLDALKIVSLGFVFVLILHFFEKSVQLGLVLEVALGLVIASLVYVILVFALRLLSISEIKQLLRLITEKK